MIYEITAMQFPIEIRFINGDYCNVETINNIANAIKYSIYYHIKPVKKQ